MSADAAPLIEAVGLTKHFPVAHGGLRRGVSFVHALDRKDEKSLAIVSTIIGLAHSLKMEVVAEGVETSEQLELLIEMKCDQVQGFLLGRPIAGADILKQFLAPKPSAAV